MGITRNNVFDGGCRKVLAVNAQPICATTSEIKETIGISVPQVTCPIPSVADTLAGSLVVVVVALK